MSDKTIPIGFLLYEQGSPRVRAAMKNIASDTADLKTKLTSTTKAADDLSAAMVRAGNTAWRGFAADAKKSLQSAAQDSDTFWKGFVADAKKSLNQASEDSKKLSQDIKAVQKDLDKSPVGLRNALRDTVTTARALGPAMRAGGATGATALQNMTWAAQRLNTALQQVQDRKLQFSALSEAAGQAQMAGSSMMLAGVGGLALAGKSAIDAGEYNRLRAGIRGTVSLRGGSEADGDAFMTRLQEFDRRFAAIDIRGAASTAQSAMARGFNPDELLNKAGNGLMDKIARAVTLGGGGTEELNAVFKQLGDIRTRGKATAQDMNAIAEGGKINIREMLQKFVTPERFAEIASQKPGTLATSTEVFGALNAKTGLDNPKYAKGAADVMNELPAKFENFKSAMFQLSADWGQYVEPVLKGLVDFGTALADFGRAIPGPMKAVIVWGGLLTLGIVTLGGAILVAAGTVGQLAIGISALGIGAGAATVATDAAVASTGVLAGVALPALAVSALATGAVLLGIGLALGLLVYELNKYREELKKPIETVTDTRDNSQKGQDAGSAKVVRDIVAAAKADTNVNTRGKIQVLQAASRKLGDLGFTDEALDLANERAALAKNAPPSAAKGGDAYAEKITNITANYRMSLESVKREDKTEPQSKAEAAMAKAQAQMDAVQKKMGEATSSTPLTPATASTMQAAAGGFTMPTAPDSGASAVIDNTNVIRTLESQKRALKGKEHAAERDALNEQIISLRQQEQDSRRGAAELRRAAAEKARDQKAALSAQIAQVNASRDVAENDRQRTRDADLARLKAAHEAEVAAVRATANKYNRTAIASRVRELNVAYDTQKARIRDDAEREIDAMKAEAIRRDAKLKAGTQSGAQAAATLAIGEAKASALLHGSALGGVAFGGSVTPGGALGKASALFSRLPFGSTAAHGDGGSRIAIGAGSAVAPLVPWMAGELNPAGGIHPMSGREQYAMAQLDSELSSASNMTPAYAGYNGGGAGSLYGGRVASADAGEARFDVTGSGSGSVTKAVQVGGKVYAYIDPIEIKLDDSNYIKRSDGRAVGVGR